MHGSPGYGMVEREARMTDKRPLRRREAEEILRALEGGVVPAHGVQHLLVGRSNETAEILRILQAVKEGASEFKLWVGDFGSGKSFMLRTIAQLALSMHFVTSTVDLTPTRRIHASDGKGVLLYQEILRRLETRGVAPGRALETLLSVWADALGAQGEESAFQAIRDLPAGGLKFELAHVVRRYMEARRTGNTALGVDALRWMMGEMPTKTEAK